MEQGSLWYDSNIFERY